MSNEKQPVRFVPISGKEDAVIISFERKRCRLCKGLLYGGEVDYGVCDSCDGDVEYDD